MWSFGQPVTLRCFGRLERADDNGFERDFARSLRFRELIVFIHHACEQRAIERAPVDANTHRLVVFDGDFDHRAEIIVVLFSDVDVARIDAIFSQRAGTGRILFQQQMAVVVEIADDGHIDAEKIQRIHNLRNSGGGGLGIHRDADEFGTGARQRHCLIDRGLNVSSIRIRHGLHDDGVGSAYLNTANIHRDRLTPGNLCHLAS